MRGRLGGEARSTFSDTHKEELADFINEHLAPGASITSDMTVTSHLRLLTQASLTVMAYILMAL